MLAMTIGIANPVLAQEKQPAGGPQPSPSAPGPNGNQATNPPAPSGAAPADNQSGTQPSNNQASNPPANNNSGANQPADQGVQTVTGDLVPGYDPIAMHFTETVTSRLEVRDSDGKNPSPTTSYKLVTGTKDGTAYAYVETPRGRWPVHEVAVLDGKSFTTMYALGPNNSALVSVPADAKPFTRARNEDALREVNRKQSGERQPPPDQEQESPQRGQSQQGRTPPAGPASAGGGAKAANAGALENNNNKSNNKDDGKNSETRTERAPAGHSSKPTATPTKLQHAVAAAEPAKTGPGGSDPLRADKLAHEPPGPAGKPATATAKSQPPAKLVEFDTSHMGVASKKTDSPATAHETALLTKLDTSHLGTASNGTKPASAPASTQPAGKLSAFDTSHMGGATRLQSLSRPALPVMARTFTSQH
jgi:hypothetical protein